MTKIVTLTNKERDKIDVQVQMCLQILYMLEDLTDYKETDITNCINFLENLNVESVNSVVLEDM